MAGYIGSVPVPQSTQTRDSFVATAGQTSFATKGYTPGFVDVFLNGIHLDPADFTATNGTDVVLASGAISGDVVTVVAFSVVDLSSLSSPAGTVNNSMTVTTSNYQLTTTIPENSSWLRVVYTGEHSSNNLGLTNIEWAVDSGIEDTVTFTIPDSSSRTYVGRVSYIYYS